MSAVRAVIVDIRNLSLDYQSPECLDEEIVQAKMMQLHDGQVFEPLDVRSDGESLILADGFHRVEAARRYGVTEMSATVTPDTLERMEEEWRCALAASLTRLRGEVAGKH